MSSEGQGTRAAVAAIAKNEAPYLAEWAAYHRLLGFDQILVYDHESTDATRAVLERLAGEKVLAFLDWSPVQNDQVQKLAYGDAVRRLRPGFDWVTFIDIDEFIVLPQHDDIHEFLADYADLEAIAMNWKLFGTSGYEHRQEGLVTEVFDRCAEQDHSGNRAIKTLVRPRRLVKPNLHNHQFAEGVVYQTVTGEEIPPGTGRSESVTHDLIRVNHYFTKSRDEWDAKVARGRATKPPGHPDKFRTEKHFTRHNRNEALETDIQAYGPRIRAYLAERGLTDLLPGGPAARVGDNSA